MYHSTSVFPKKISIKVVRADHHPLIIDLTAKDNSLNKVTIFLTKKKAKELFLELELALGEFDEERKEEDPRKDSIAYYGDDIGPGEKLPDQCTKEKMIEMDEADPSLV